MTAASTDTTTTTVGEADLFDRSRSIDARAEPMRFSRERAVAGVASGLNGLGGHVTWRARRVGVPLRTTSAITVFDAPRRFVDEQRTGPFRGARDIHAFPAPAASRPGWTGYASPHRSAVQEPSRNASCSGRPCATSSRRATAS